MIYCLFQLYYMIELKIFLTLFFENCTYKQQLTMVPAPECLQIKPSLYAIADISGHQLRRMPAATVDITITCFKELFFLAFFDVHRVSRVLIVSGALALSSALNFPMSNSSGMALSVLSFFTFQMF